jgi:hypothetical protein
MSWHGEHLSSGGFLRLWTSAICGASYQRLNDELSNDGSAGSAVAERTNQGH